MVDDGCGTRVKRPSREGGGGVCVCVCMCARRRRRRRRIIYTHTYYIHRYVLYVWGIHTHPRHIDLIADGIM